MKILHIVGGELSWGAARGAYWLHQGLCAQDVDSHLVVQSGEATGPRLQPLAKTKVEKLFCYLRTKSDQLPLLFYPNRKRWVFSTGLCGWDVTRVDGYEWADIIHLHWINNGMIKFPSLKRADKPIVWTFRDMWPFTGGCHIAMDCEKYKTGCGRCPQLASRRKHDLSRYIAWKKKQSITRHVHPVCISHWHRQCAKDSELFGDFDVDVIHNGIDPNLFSPVEKSIAREILNLPTDRKIVLVGFQSEKEVWKGFNKFLEALELLEDKDYFYLFFGKLKEDSIKGFKVDYKNLGFLKDDIALRLAYSAADVFIAPSIQESFGKTLIESMSCETPVVCFDATGPKDIVTHCETGYKATPYDPTDLAKGIDWVLSTDERSRSLGRNARARVLDNFTIEIIADRYRNLYEKILKEENFQ